jgi:hypothetical protein
MEQKSSLTGIHKCIVSGWVTILMVAGSCLYSTFAADTILDMIRCLFFVIAGTATGLAAIVYGYAWMIMEKLREK